MLERLIYAVDSDKVLRKYIRLQAEASGTKYPLVVVDGEEPPQLKGRSSYYTNKNGTEIRWPNAYRKAWGKTIYNPSSRRIEVGANWVLDVLMMHKHLKEL